MFDRDKPGTVLVELRCPACGFTTSAGAGYTPTRPMGGMPGMGGHFIQGEEPVLATCGKCQDVVRFTMGGCSRCKEAFEGSEIDGRIVVGWNALSAKQPTLPSPKCRVRLEFSRSDFVPAPEFRFKL